MAGIGNPKPNLNSDTAKKMAKKKKSNNGEFEFCKVCNLNHNQGRRHNYFPNHTKSLSSFLSRFLSKLSDVRFSLKDPSPLRPEHASRNRLWCIFCDADIDELGSSFACNNAINHLASLDHLKNLKSFLWKHGGGMDRVDSFRVSEADLAKWEKKCKLLKSTDASSSEGSCRPLLGPSNDIHNELNYENINNFDKNVVYSLESSLSNGVMPLQYHTNEIYQVSHSEFFGVPKVGSLLHDVTSFWPAETHSSTDLWNLKDLTVANGGSSSQSLQYLTQICSKSPEEAEGNVHSGAPPPWFEATEGNKINVLQKPGFGSLTSPINKSGKSHKLNPKRVGAAWAERRKIELEMEKRGEIVTSNCDVNWLPNFGRVWQSGSRKESRKEFETEKQKLPKVENQSDLSIKIQPYISKRMRRDVND
uniref:TITAN-like protein n=1 Tax=Vitis vinifera TaxID=29760 RepID=F6GSV9_VITVI